MVPVLTSVGFGPYKITDVHLGLMRVECEKEIRPSKV